MASQFHDSLNMNDFHILTVRDLYIELLYFFDSALERSRISRWN